MDKGRFKAPAGESYVGAFEERGSAKLGWSAPPERFVLTTKTIEYACGCKIELSDHGSKEAGHVCETHFKRVKCVTTVEKYMDPLPPPVKEKSKRARGQKQ